MQSLICLKKTSNKINYIIFLQIWQVYLPILKHVIVLQESEMYLLNIII